MADTADASPPLPTAPWRNRIVGYGTEAPDQLLANPRNWRVHPTYQQEAAAAVLAEVGWVQSVIVNRRTGFVVDGHMRVGMALRREEPEVPVVYVDLSEEEEALVLAALDPISAMAGTDTAQLQALLNDILPATESVSALLDRVEALYGNAPVSFDPLAPIAGEQAPKVSTSLRLTIKAPEYFEAVSDAVVALGAQHPEWQLTVTASGK